ncbi:MAG TPA: phosphate signaling complex protein PhoU [Fimbriimonadaceae bacterium]|nr:phosphate signaling complex protein PhoU [Fimbriimonadaceae bacterium]
MSLTRSQFEEELEKLRNRILAMGSEADRAVADAMLALGERDVALAEEVIDADDRIDELDLEIEGECMRLIALQHPLARDLRLVGTGLKIITDLERIGDHAVDIAKVARKLARNTVHRSLADLPRMATSVRQMLKTALDAFVRHDLSLVEKVVDADDEVDDLFHEIREDLHKAMQKDPDVIVEASYLLFVAHYLERMADHAVNIAERVYFVETGQLSQLAKSHKTGS